MCGSIGYREVARFLAIWWWILKTYIDLSQNTSMQLRYSIQIIYCSALGNAGSLA